MEIGLVHKVDIDREMQQAYLDYAMSVIVSRALPDARDGLKPVHRRILYAMYDMGLRPDAPFKKSARIVGEVLGKYHPHGDLAVYEAMARMAQDFSMRYLLVDGQGNFGSIDGDPPAAMRYTEARLSPISIHLLTDIEKATVDFTPNFDGTLNEPVVLPSALPNLLVNGATGIAVGMATSVPPHNLSEIIDASIYMLEKWDNLDDVSIADLMRFVQGPDFPTGGVIIHEAGGDGLMSAYSTGRGRVTIQASAHLEEMERGRSRIIVTELPYMTNKSSLIERIAELVREEKLQGIADLRDESDRQGMRIVIELTKSVEAEATLRDLYRLTPMQDTFSIIMLALVEGEPRLLSLKQALRVYLEHRLEIVRRRAEYDLEKARQRAHILEGLRIALQHLDEVIALIRNSPDVDTARGRLIRRFKLTEIQAQAILDMPLRRLASLERRKIEEEYKEIRALIKELDILLRSPKKMRQVVGEELKRIKDLFGDRRRTHIVELKEGQLPTALLTTSDLLPEKATWVSVTQDNLISRSLDDHPPASNGRHSPWYICHAHTRDTLYLVSERGVAAALPVHALIETNNPGDGVPIHKASPFPEGEPLAGIIAISPHTARDAGTAEMETGFVLTVTRQGMVKKTALTEIPGASANMFQLVKVNPGDSLGWLAMTNGRSEIFLVTHQGMAIRFKEDEVRPMGLLAVGVMGIKLQKGDEVAGVEVLPTPGALFFLASNGLAKRVGIDQFPVQGRYGQGVVAWKLPPQSIVIGFAAGEPKDRVIVHLEKLAPKIIFMEETPLQTRSARGRKIFEDKIAEQIVRLTPLVKSPTPKEPAGKAKKQESIKRAASRQENKPVQGQLQTALDSASQPAISQKQSGKRKNVSGATAETMLSKPVMKKPIASSQLTGKESSRTKSPKKEAERLRLKTAPLATDKPAPLHIEKQPPRPTKKISPGETHSSVKEKRKRSQTEEKERAIGKVKPSAHKITPKKPASS